jgi:hypothetical protein
MPQPRKHSSDAQRQAACRRRRSQALAALQAAKGLAPLPSIATMPGWTRWRQILAQVEEALRNVQEQMQSYYDDRSEDWQESDKADEFTEKIEAIDELVGQVGECRDKIG